jgi:hypothetical protein
LGAAGAKGYYSPDIYFNSIYQANISKVQSKTLFEQSYQNISAPLKEIIDAVYPNYDDI